MNGKCPRFQVCVLKKSEVDVDELDENKFQFEGDEDSGRRRRRFRTKATKIQDEGDEDSGQSDPDEGDVNNFLMLYPNRYIDNR